MTIIQLLLCIIIGFITFGLLEFICGLSAWILSIATAFTSRSRIGVVIKIVLIFIMCLVLPIVGMFTIYPEVVKFFLHVDLYEVLNHKII